MFTDTLDLDLATVEPSLAARSARRPRAARIGRRRFAKVMAEEFKKEDHAAQRFPVADANYDLGNGDVVIAAITSCTNTSNPSS